MSDFWFNRFIEYWTLPAAEQVVDHVRRGHVQVVQVGNFGPDFYGLAEDADVERSWAGMPAVGIEENLQRAAELIPQIQAAGSRVVGQLSSTLHYGDHECGLGLFGQTWDRMWTAEILGEAPVESVIHSIAREATGEPARRAIDGRPYFSYRGCISNPAWLAILKAMVRKGIELGLDGFNTTHNYESFCGCRFCASEIRSHMEQHFSGAELDALFDTSWQEAEDLRKPSTDVSEILRRRYVVLLEQAAARRRKAAFDEVFIDYGRSLRPGLLAAQWYHKYGMRVNDERAALPAELWARGEDYIWYSQGPHRWGSSIEQGYIADMGLNARHMHAAGGGRPFVINKYDYRRWRVWAGEAAAHGAASPCYHAGPPYAAQEETTRIAPEDYYGPIIRNQRFLFEHEELLHPAKPIAQFGLVYPRRAEREFEEDYLDALKRIAEWLEDAHVLYDILFDDQLADRAGEFPTLILPDVRRLADNEIEALRQHVDKGGQLMIAGATGTLDEHGEPRAVDSLLQESVKESGEEPGASVFHWKSTDWQPQTAVLRTLPSEPEMPVYSRLPDDAEGQSMIARLDELCGGYWMLTSAPWSVRVRAWRAQDTEAIPIHWINYLQDEAAVIEIPIPVGPIRAEFQLPTGAVVKCVEWRYPEMKEVIELAHEIKEGWISFEIPRLIVHGMSVIRLQPAS